MKPSFLVDELKKRGFNNFTGVPCSIVKPIINQALEDSDINYLPATIEGEALSFAAGNFFAGKKTVVMLQNSGLGNIVNPVTSLMQIYKIPTLLLITWRGEPTAKPDAYQHEVMGKITLELLELLNISYEILTDSEEHLSAILSKAKQALNENKLFAIVIKKGIFENKELTRELEYKRETSFKNFNSSNITRELSREAVLKEISAATVNSPVITTTGYISRDFYGAGDRESNFYMQGSMGFALPISLSLSLNTSKTVFCIDGDGALLMRMGGLFTAGTFSKGNLIYILLDNAAYDSTGGQATISSNLHFEKLAEAAKFTQFFAVNQLAEVKETINTAVTSHKLSFIYIKIKQGKGEGSERPNIIPPEMKSRFINYISRIL